MAFMTIENMREREWAVSWSGGKDSTATIILCHENNIPIKEILYVRMMYDKDLPATLPVMTDFVDRAKGVFESWGYKVRVVPSIKTAKDLIDFRYTRSKKHPEKNGKPYGIMAFGRGHCKFTGVKQKTIASILESEYELIGYGVDEVERLGRITEKKQSIMCTLGVTEKEAFKICDRYNLLSPLYALGFARDGCWFCPNAGVQERKYLKENNPELIEKIRDMIRLSDYDVSYFVVRNNWLIDYTRGEL